MSGAAQAFRPLLLRLLGLQFSDDKLDLLSDVLRQRTLEGRFESEEAYLLMLERGALAREELGRLAEALTVTETYFFRNPDHFRALIEVALPVRLRARGADQRLNILCAACASGEEPYSLAMCLDDQFPELKAWDLRLRGVDVNPAMLAKAAKALYTPWSLRETPAAMRERYFKPVGPDFQLRPDIQAQVSFEARNLCEANPDLWPSGSYDIIFCRNMIMYLAPEAASALIARMARALAPGGFLFLGYAETLRGLSQDFHLCHTHSTFYYQLAGPEERAAALTPAARERPKSSEMPLAQSWDPSLSWVDAIQKASDRIAGLASRAGQAPSERAAGPAPGPAAQAWSLRPALELLSRERFDEALAVLQALPPGASEDPEALLLRAVLLSNAGQVPEAEAACRHLLQRDELNAGAHYIQALCCEQAGDLARAGEEDRTAMYLDASFAMPCLHLGLLARRAGDAAMARRHLTQALQLLTREDPSRLLLFGGGFGREGLVGFCRSSLSSLGAA
jgi:chemotaxis protein methyltransferase CheR